MHDFLEDAVEGVGEIPVGQMGTQLAEIGDVTDVVSFSWLVAILPTNAPSDKLLNARKRFKDGDAVLPSATNIVDLTWTRVEEKLFGGANHVETMDVVANLLALEAENGINAAGNGDLDKIG